MIKYAWTCCKVFYGVDDGGGDEEGEEGAVDGVIGGPRVGKERQLSHNGMKIDLLYCWLDLEEKHT